MIRNNYKFIMVGVVLCFISYIAYDGMSVQSTMPAPTEFLEKKENKKEFKKHRKEFYEYMHQSDSDVDWREIDRKTRKEKTDNSKIILELSKIKTFDLFIVHDFRLKPCFFMDVYLNLLKVFKIKLIVLVSFCVPLHLEPIVSHKYSTLSGIVEFINALPINHFSAIIKFFDMFTN